MGMVGGGLGVGGALVALVAYFQVRSACGMGQAAMGPFYCPSDEKLYLDLSFFRDLQSRFRAPGDFAQAYVIAHEVGHHVQKLTGSFQKMESSRGRVSKEEMNRLSVRMELMAHGSSEQRVRWFKRGMESGRPKDCDTFTAAAL